MKRLSAALAVLLTMALPASAQQMQHGHASMNHQDMQNMGNMRADEGVPTETGQSAFAAIQEIVGILDADPNTDWSKVDIGALRQHLVDMNNVTLSARVSSRVEQGRMRFEVLGDGPVADSIRRMVTAHAAAMNGVNGWRFAAENLPDGAALTVTPPNASQMQKLKALGFFGVLAEGMHHQQHHLMMARGLPH